MNAADILKTHSAELKTGIGAEAYKKLGIYAEALREWNEKVNLTAITDDEGIAVKHFLDCLKIFDCVSISDGASLIDVGTGAGFPGLVIAAVRPDLRVTLLDSTGKKLKAVEDIAARMGVNNVSFLHARAEEAGRLPEYREKFDFATARAVAELRVLLEYAAPFVKMGGTFVSMKGSAMQEEIDGAKQAFAVLGTKIEAVNTFELPNGDSRAVITVKKISQLSPKYPRPSAQIAKKPL